MSLARLQKTRIDLVRGCASNNLSVQLARVTYLQKKKKRGYFLVNFWRKSRENMIVHYQQQQ
jgi:hypothetical protein